MNRADNIGRRLLWIALLMASVLLLILMVLESDETNDKEAFISVAQNVEITPLAPLHERWLLNAGDAHALDELPGVGAVIAERIIACRETDGLFYFPEDIMEVKGIGVKTMRSILQWLKENPERAYVIPE